MDHNSRLARIIKNVGLVFLSLGVTFLLLETVCFRLLAPATDMPENQFVDGVIKYAPGQTGVYRVKSEIAARYRINENGWNSGHPRYPRARSSKFRVAIIGDSYVDALIVDYDRSLAERLEAKLGAARAEVFRFGMSGAPFSQYLHMLRVEVLPLRPDVVVVNLVHNDFDESYEFVPGRYTSSFLKLKVEPGALQPVTEIPPTPYRWKWYENLRYSAIFRYLVYQQRLDVARLKALVMGGAAESRPQYLANIDVSALDTKLEKTALAVNYLMGEMQKLSQQHNFALVFLMDGVREDIYAGVHRTEGARSLNELAKSLAGERRIPFLDLHPVFEADYRQHRQPFNYQSDLHWNAYGHEIAAETLYNLLAHSVRLASPPGPGQNP